MVNKELTLDQKMELFGKALSFQVAEDKMGGRINLEKRFGFENIPDRWAIVRSSSVYCQKNDDWEYEPLPSSRSSAFKRRCYYSLETAYAIATSPEFKCKYTCSES